MKNQPKRLIEVDLPIRRISEHARKDQNIRKGHLHTMHVWWATRPLASCRAVLMAMLLPDPADPNCPPAFIDKARHLMHRWASDHAAKASAESLKRLAKVQKNPALLNRPLELRGALLDFIADFAAWEAGVDAEYLRTARALVAAAHPEGPPLVLDPFAGAGSIPFEALRIGAEAFSGDLNPVAVLINKVALEYLPKYGRRLAEGVEKWGKWVLEEARKLLAPYYPADPKGHIPLAYIWARTITCEGPGCGAEVPLLGMLWLSRKSKNLVALRYRPAEPGGPAGPGVNTPGSPRSGEPGVSTPGSPTPGSTGSPTPGPPGSTPRKTPRRSPPRVVVEIFRPKSEREVQPPIVRRFAATCPVCGYTTPYKRVREQLRAKRGGTRDARLLAVITLDQHGGRHFRLPTDEDVRAAELAAEALDQKTKAQARRQKAEVGRAGASDFSPAPWPFVPQEPTPPDGTLGYRINKYGMEQWSDVYLPRQALALGTFCELVRQARQRIVKETNDAPFADAVATSLALAVSNLLHYLSSVSIYALEGMISAFVQGSGLAMRPDFAEANPLMPKLVGGVEYAFGLVCDFLRREGATVTAAGTAQCGSATAIPLPDESVAYVVTDPPYYDAVPYAALSDFCYVWLKRAVGTIHPELLKTELTPKAEECILDPGPPADGGPNKDRAYFEATMEAALAEARRVLRPGGMCVVIFAHKGTAGWEALLNALVSAGWTVTASWPIDTERASRMRARDSAVLASSVHLVCRPRAIVGRPPASPASAGPAFTGGARRRDDPVYRPAASPASASPACKGGAICGAKCGAKCGSPSGAIGDWRDVLAELPKRIHQWLPRLRDEGIVGADAIFACLGPALEIFSRYDRVEKASGQQVTLREYLEQVWAAVAKEALRMVFEGADASGFEEDARLTAMWLWTLQTNSEGRGQETEGEEQEGQESEDEESGGAKKKVNGRYALEFDAARKIAQGLGAHLENLTTVVAVKGQTARLLSVSERSAYLLGKREEDAPAKGRRKTPQQPQLPFPDDEDDEDVAPGTAPRLAPPLQAGLAPAPRLAPPVKAGQYAGHRAWSTLDRVHQAMLLFAAGRSEALRRFLVEEGVGRDAKFWTLAQALSALYPRGSEEKRWVEGVLARKKGLGF